MRGLPRDETAEPVSRDQILRRERGQGQGNIHFLYSDHDEQECQPYPFDPYSRIICDDHTPPCELSVSFYRPVFHGMYTVHQEVELLLVRNNRTAVVYTTFIPCCYRYTYSVVVPGVITLKNT